MRLKLALLLSALLLPGASAAGYREFTIDDAAGDALDPAADLLRVLLSAEDDGLRVTFEVADGDEDATRDHTYWVRFRIRDADIGVALGFGDGPTLRSWSATGPGGCLACREWNRGGFERVANEALVDLRVRRDAATWSGLLPWGDTPGLLPGATLADITAGTAAYDRGAQRWAGGLDTASTTAPYVAAIEPKMFPILVPAWMLPAIVAACAVGGGAAGLGLSRVARRRPPPAPTPIPVRAEPPPPGERFRRAPPPR